MKNVLIIIMIAVICPLFSQTSKTINYDMSLGDTTIYIDGLIDVSGYLYSFDVLFEDSKHDFVLSLESGIIESNPVIHEYYTRPSYSLLFPYRIHPEKYLMKMQRFISYEGFSSNVPVLKIYPNASATDTITIKIDFFR